MTAMGSLPCLTAMMLLAAGIAPAGAEIIPHQLPEPQMDIEMTLFQALAERKSSRSFSETGLSDQVLSDILWAAFGINRPESGRRTAPSAMDQQEIDIYVATESGLFLYDAAAGSLVPVLGEDIRAVTGMQPFVADAPVSLVFVADFDRMDDRMDEEAKVLFSAADTGYISQNVYLCCAALGLSTVARGAIDKAALAEAMGLRPGQRIILAQTIGYPGEEG